MTVVNVMFRKHAQELRDMWQGRLLAQAGDLTQVMQSVLAHSYPEAIETLMRVVYPGFKSIPLPFYCSAAKIDVDGRIVADVVDREGHLIKNAEVFRSERDLQTAMRRLADKTKLTDPERVEMFKVVKAWIVADRRAPVEGPLLSERFH